MTSVAVGLGALVILFLVGFAVARVVVRRYGPARALLFGLIGAPLVAALGIPIALLSSRVDSPSFVTQAFVDAAPAWGFLFGFLVSFYQVYRRGR